MCLLRNRSCNRRILRSVSCSTRAFSVGSAASCFNSLEMGTPAGRDHHLTAVQWHSLLYTACTFPERLVHRLVRRHCQISSTSSQYFSFTQCYCCLDIICTSGFSFSFKGGQPVNHVRHPTLHNRPSSMTGLFSYVKLTLFGPVFRCLVIKTRTPTSHIYSHSGIYQ